MLLWNPIVKNTFAGLWRIFGLFEKFLEFVSEWIPVIRDDVEIIFSAPNIAHNYWIFLFVVLCFFSGRG